MRLLGVLTAVLVVACAAVAGLSSAASTALPRATEDRPDEVAGEQVHFLYVIPTDAPDEQLDVNGELNASIARMQAWLAGQTGGPKLRLDTYQGQPDITFVRTSVAYGPDQGIRRVRRATRLYEPEEALSRVSRRIRGRDRVWPREPRGRGCLSLLHVAAPERSPV